MRFVPTPCLREGMILAKSLHTKDGSLLLHQGQRLKAKYIDHIKRYGFRGIYISDNLSEDIVIESIINDELRNSAVRAVKDVFIRSQDPKAKEDITSDAKDVIKNLVDEITHNKDIVINMVDLRSFDDYTYYHSVNVAVLSLIIGVALGMGKTELYKLGLSALLHDIGKIFIDKGIVDKPGSLTLEEYEQMKKHSQAGYDYLNSGTLLDIPVPSLVGVLQHHERFDGTGYPMGLAGKKITAFGRIIAISDVYDAMTSDRPYRQAMSPSDVMEFLMGGAGTLFDAEYVYLFTRKVAAYPLGTCVLLSNGMTGIVVENYEDCCMRPKLRIICSYESTPIYFDLRNDKGLMNVTVSGVVKM